MTGAAVTEIFGTCDPQFNPVKDAFSRNFVINEEVGAAVSVYMQGEKVVDLWGGYADERQKVAWQEDTLCAFYSTGKPFVATSLLRQVDAGRIKLDDPVCSVWPEFAAAGKEQITFRQLLCHQSGVVAIGNKLPREAAYDWELMVGEIAAQRPWWEPGSRHVYHTHTFGFLVGETVRRITGLMPGDYLQQEIMGPLGDELYVGVADEDLGRLAVMARETDFNIPNRPTVSILDREISDEEKMLVYAVANPPGTPDGGEGPLRGWQKAQIPATNGHGTARAIAHFYAVQAMGGEMDGLRLLSPELLTEATSIQSEGYCPILKRNVKFGLGFQITQPDRPFGSSEHSFGHYGNGGSLGYADPDAGVGFAYVMNYIPRRKQNARSRDLTEALGSCV